MALTNDLLGAFEVHDPEGIRSALNAGLNPRAPIKGKAPIDWLIEFYMRSGRFAQCLRVMLDAGAAIDDAVLQATLLDEPDALGALLEHEPSLRDRTFSFPCAFTSLDNVSALHVCAEYNATRCARVLLDAGLDPDTRAATDAENLGGHSALFHTVNSLSNYCRPMMDLLISAGASIDIRLTGLVWGASFDWEMILYDITPISYAQCALLPQFHRRDEHVYDNIETLCRARDGSAPTRRNVPNKYVADS